MSQIFRDSTAGPVPPSVPEQFTADDGNIGIPVANNYNILSRETTDNNLQGIQTTVDPNGSDNHYIELTNRISGFISTNDATPTTIVTFPLGATPGVYSFQGSLEAFNTTDIAGAAYTWTAGVRTTGAAGIQIGTEFKDVFEEAAMSTADFDVSVSGNNLIIQVVGIAAKAIDWRALVTYRFVG